MAASRSPRFLASLQQGGSQLGSGVPISPRHVLLREPFGILVVLAAAAAGAPAASPPTVPWVAEHRPPLSAPQQFFAPVQAAQAGAQPAGLASPNGWGCWLCPWLC